MRSKGNILQAGHEPKVGHNELVCVMCKYYSQTWLYESQGTAENIRITQTFAHNSNHLFSDLVRKHLVFLPFFIYFATLSIPWLHYRQLLRIMKKNEDLEKICVFEIIYLKGKKNRQLLNLNIITKKIKKMSNQIQYNQTFLEKNKWAHFV